MRKVKKRIQKNTNYTHKVVRNKNAAVFDEKERQ